MRRENEKGRREEVEERNEEKNEDKYDKEIKYLVREKEIQKEK